MIKREKLRFRELINEILDKLPEELFISDKTTFLDPCFAAGQFLNEISVRLLKYGHSKENIKSRLFGIEKSRLNLFLISKYHEVEGNFYYGDVLKDKYFTDLNNNILEIENMKFDLVISNPPYQSADNVNKAYPLFLKQAISLLKKDGHLGYIMPSSFAYRDGKNNKNIRNALQGKLKYLDLTASRHFQQIGEDICAFIFTDKSTETDILFYDDNKNIRNNRQYIDDFDNLSLSEKYNIKKNILNKIKYSKFKKLQLKTDCNLSRDGFYSETKTDTHIYDFVYNASNIGYSNMIFGKGLSKKIVINIHGYYFLPSCPEKYIFKSTAMTGKGATYLEYKTEQEAENILSFLKSNVYRFYVDNEKTSGFNTGLKDLPQLNTTKTWTNEEIYLVFNLNKQEVDYIERSVK